MNKETCMKEAEESILHTYNRFPVVFDHGEGVYLYDTDGKEYLDFAAGIAVQAFGYNNKEYNDALKAQIDKVMHTSNLYYNVPIMNAAKRVLKASQMNRVFFTNSGAEAIEGALKLARKYVRTKTPDNKGEIIAMEHSFHGRTMGALSVTGTKHYREPFEPLIGGVSFAKYNDLDSVKALITPDTCAIIMESLQGEGGIHPATEEFMKGVRALCDENGIVLILDEIQCGMGRTGEMFAFQHYGIQPDIITSAKALGCGVPVGAFAAREEIARALVPGDHGTTYGGNPLATAAVCKVFEIFKKEHIVEHVKELTPYLREKLESLAAKHASMKEVRGIGFMQGIESDIPAGDIVGAAQEKGLILISAGTNIIRIVPPLIAEKEHIDEMCRILDEIFTEKEA